MKLINGIKQLGPAGSQTGGSIEEETENERPKRKQSNPIPASASERAKAQHQQSNGSVKSNAGGSEEPSASVFKSANWLSDSELIFSLTNQVGGLVRALRVFQELDIGIKHVESRPSKRRESEFEIFVDIDCSDKEKMRKLVHHLR